MSRECNRSRFVRAVIESLDSKTRVGEDTRDDRCQHWLCSSEQAARTRNICLAIVYAGS